jgi:hypothetical protein
MYIALVTRLFGTMRQNSRQPPPPPTHHLKVPEDKCGITLPYAENANISAVLCVM